MCPVLSARLRDNCAVALARSCSVECSTALSSSRSIAARRRGEFCQLLSHQLGEASAVASAGKAKGPPRPLCWSHECTNSCHARSRGTARRRGSTTSSKHSQCWSHSSATSTQDAMRRAATHLRRIHQIRTYATKRSPYAVLGVDRGATEREIKTKFRALAKALHPDTRSPDAAGDLGEVLEAYASLTDRHFDVSDLVAASVEIFSIEELRADDRHDCLLYTSPSPRDATLSRMPSSA